jgi:hypothetical protein
LHDVVEDTSVKLHDQRRLGYSEEVLAAVELLSRRPDDSYEQFIERVLPNAIARVVKRADLEDKMELRRLCAYRELDEAVEERLRLILKRVV